MFARLESGLDYEAVDSQPVDLVFMLLAPENAGADHLKALARVSRLLRNQQACEKLRAAAHGGSDLRDPDRPRLVLASRLVNSQNLLHGRARPAIQSHIHIAFVSSAFSSRAGFAVALLARPAPASCCPFPARW